VTGGATIHRSLDDKLHIAGGDAAKSGCCVQSLVAEGSSESLGGVDAEARLEPFDETRVACG